MTGKHLYIISQGWQLKNMFTSAQPRGMNIRWNPFLYLSVLFFLPLDGQVATFLSRESWVFGLHNPLWYGLVWFLQIVSQTLLSNSSNTSSWKHENFCIFSRKATLGLALSIRSSVHLSYKFIKRQNQASKSSVKIKCQNNASKSSVKIKSQNKMSKSSVKIKHQIQGSSRFLNIASRLS